LYVLVQSVLSKNTWLATTSQAFSFSHWALTFLMVFWSSWGHIDVVLRPCWIPFLVHVLSSSRPQKASCILITLYVGHSIHCFSPWHVIESRRPWKDTTTTTKVNLIMLACLLNFTLKPDPNAKFHWNTYYLNYNRIFQRKTSTDKASAIKTLQQLKEVPTTFFK